jgi:penicillin-binding protein 1A
MLRGVVDYGTGNVIRDYGVEGMVAGKTGTTNNGTDVWFIGYTPTLVAGFWFGYDNPRPISYDASGGRLAAPAWAEFYLNGWEDSTPPDSWQPPTGMIPVKIDARTGYLANEWCPITQKAYFKPGTIPTHPCPIHSEPPVDSTNVLQEVPDAIKEGVQGIGRFFKHIFKR